MSAKDRLRLLIESMAPEKGRFGYLASIGGGSAESWKAFWHGRQRPTCDMLEAAARQWPEFAFWLITGITDQQNGHHAPQTADTYPEPLCYPREQAKRYFALALSMKRIQEAGLESPTTASQELKRMRELRHAEAEELERSEKVSPDEETAVQHSLNELSTATTPERRSTLVKVLNDLQRRKALSDEQFAHMLELSLDDLENIKLGSKALPLRSRFIMVDKWGYTLLRDLVLLPLPASWAAAALNADIQNGQNMHQPPPAEG